MRYADLDPTDVYIARQNNSGTDLSPNHADPNSHQIPGLILTAPE